MRLQAEWEWIQRWPRLFWLSTCQRSLTSLRQPEKSIPRQTISKDWRQCCRRCCKASPATRRATSQFEHSCTKIALLNAEAVVPIACKVVSRARRGADVYNERIRQTAN